VNIYIAQYHFEEICSALMALNGLFCADVP